MTAVLPGPELTVGRLDCTYLVAKDHPDGAAAGWRMDTALRPRYADACREALEPLLDPADPSVWIIDRLHLETSLRVGGDPAELSRRWGAALARAMTAVLRGEVTEGVIRYRNRAAWLAAFTADLVAGDGERPAYAALSGVLALPTGRAVVTAAEGQGVPVAHVLMTLAEAGRLAAVLERLPAADAAAVWRACVAAAGSAPEPPELVRSAERAIAGLRAGRAGTSVPELALCTLAAVAPTPGATAEKAVAAVLTAVAAVARGGGASPDAVVPGTGRRREVAPTSVTPGEHPADVPAISSPPDGVLAASPYAGVLLLLPGLIAAGLHEITACYSERSAALRYRVLLRCLGPTGRLAAGDSALLLAAGLDPSRASPGIDLPPAAEVSAALRDVLVASARISPEDEPTVLTVPALDGPVRLTTQDGLWLDAAPTAPDRTGGDVSSGTPDAAEDLAYLGTGAGPDDLAWTFVAQVGVRLFARRLTGFGTAGISHLAANVFGGGGVVTTEAGGLDVLLDPPPLQVVLHLAGLDDLQLNVPWLDGPVRILVRA